MQKAIRCAWISGLLGVVSIYALGYLYNAWDVGKNGWVVLNHKLTLTPEKSYLLVLLVTACVMYVSEFMIRWYHERRSLVALSPLIAGGRYARFFFECAYHFVATILLLYAVKVFYWHAAEYAFGADGSKYKPWFAVYAKLLQYCWYYLPAYIVLTRAFQHDPDAEKKEPAYLPWCGVAAVAAWFKVTSLKLKVEEFNPKQALFSILVKLFFVPLMTVFFFDQFNSFTRNFGYLTNHFNPKALDYTFQKGILDFYNITFTAIFVLDVGLAWAGYVFASRWIKNNIISVEPTFTGWAVALLCYPPFNSFLHLYFSPPSDKDFLSFSTGWFALLLAILSLVSYFIYMSSTIFFGLRFSNLTHRGIVDTGWYRWIRHPAYAGKNISWWLVMLPAIIYQAVTQSSWVPLLQILGLILMTVLYYHRAVTEEKHLALDPVYREYMGRVRYRFIPGLI